MVSTSSPSECHPSSASSPAPAADCSFYNTGKSSPISHSETPAPANRAPPPKGGGGGSSPGGPSSKRLGLVTPPSFLGSPNGWSLLPQLLPLWCLNVHLLHFQFFNTFHAIFNNEFCKLVGVVSVSWLDPDWYTLFTFKSDRPGLKSQPYYLPAVGPGQIT